MIGASKERSDFITLDFEELGVLMVMRSTLLNLLIALSDHSLM